MRTKTLLILAIILLASIIISIFYRKPNVNEAITSKHAADIGAIISDYSLSGDQKMAMIRVINVGDTRYKNIIDNPGMNNDQKLSSLRQIYNV